MAQKQTTQDRVLLEIYLKGREMNSEDLMRVTKLKNHQLYRALWRLNQRNFIRKRYEKTEARHKVPPTKILIVKMRDSEFARRYLSKRGLI